MDIIQKLKKQAIDLAVEYFKDVRLSEYHIDKYLEYFNKDYVVDHMIVNLIKEEYQKHRRIQMFANLDKLPRKIEGIYEARSPESFEWIAMHHLDFIEHYTFTQCGFQFTEYSQLLRDISDFLEMYYQEAMFYAKGEYNNTRDLFIDRKILKKRAKNICDKSYELINKFN